MVFSTTYGRTGYAFAVDDLGKDIAHVDPKKVMGQENLLELARSDRSLASLAATISSMRKGNEGLGKYTYQGVEKIVAYAPVKTSGWSIALCVPAAEVFEKAADLKRALLTISAAVIVIAGVVTFLVAGAISRFIAAKEHASGESQQRFEHLFRSNPTLMVLASMPDRKLADVNDAFLAKTGYARDEVLGKTGVELDLFGDPMQWVAIVSQVKEHRRASEVELRLKRKNGTVLDGLFSGEVISIQGQTYFLGVMVDISDRRRAEEALRKSEEDLRQTVTTLESVNRALAESNHLAESATRAKSEFLANMSHEIRTPMTAILGYADLLLDEEELEKVPAHHREFLATIKRNGEHLLGLINDILDLSKVEAGKLQVEQIRCSPFELLADLVSLMHVRADAKKLRLGANVIGPLPATILADPLRLRQVLVNLVGNAIKFTDQGEVRITARLTLAGDLPRLCFDVTDTGIGMSEEQQARLFRPFSQVDNSSSRRFGGTGLGLCISERLAEAMGGAIEVRSSVGKGSTFSVTIDPGPLDGICMIENASEAPCDHLPPATSSVGKIEPGRVLPADDGTESPRSITAVLEDAGEETLASAFADDPIIRRILPEFVHSLDHSVQAMAAALTGGRLPELCRLAHQLKGAGGGYGYSSITEAAMELESNARDARPAAAAASLARVSTLCRAAVRGWKAI